MQGQRVLLDFIQGSVFLLLFFPLLPESRDYTNYRSALFNLHTNVGECTFRNERLLCQTSLS